MPKKKTDKISDEAVKEEKVAETETEETKEEPKKEEPVRGKYKLASGHVLEGVEKNGFLHADNGTVNSLEGSKKL